VRKLTKINQNNKKYSMKTALGVHKNGGKAGAIENRFKAPAMRGHTLARTKADRVS
jgi:hypothetical protein